MDPADGIDPLARPAGVLSEPLIRELARRRHVRGADAIADSQFQPASLDLTLSSEAYKMPGSVLPLRGETVRALLPRFGARPLDFSDGCYMDRGQVYLVRLNERFDLPDRIAAYTNNKSSIGRLDIQTRTIGDREPRYDKHRRGFSGEVWIEVIPKSFDIRLRPGVSLSQAIFYGTREYLADAELARWIDDPGLVFDAAGRRSDDVIVDGGLMLTVDLDRDIVGYVARKSPHAIEVDAQKPPPASEFFDPIPRPKSGPLFLEKGRFYILATWESVRVPRKLAVEMLPYDTSMGEFRAHYAGFFDPGFGFGAAGEIPGRPAVLEVRSYDDDLILRHRQPICKMVYERLHGPVPRAYGAAGNHYHDQFGPRLSRHVTALRDEGAAESISRG